MSQRKLQQDIDKVLKKVKDGVQEFDLIYNKFESIDPNENQSYKEKLEMDLKREIKKLQKHREQIKLWVSKEDIKDKDQLNNLVNSRKLIETKMELFKSIEKLMKIKQFSKIALSNPQLFIDPNDKIKNESCQFVVDCINELQKQLELLETYNNNNNNGSSSNSRTNSNDSDSGDSDISQDENESIKRHLYHINNLENILKLLQNDEMSSSKLNEYKDDILYYVENNNDPDFIEYDTLYQDMGCEVTTTSATIPSSSNTNNLATPTNSNDKKKNIVGTPKKKLITSSSITTTNTSSSQPVSSTSNNHNNNNNNNNNNVTVTPNASNDINLNKKKDNTITNNKKTTEEPVLTFPKDRTDEIKEIMEKDIETNVKAFENKLFKDELKYWHNSKKKLLQPVDTMPQDLVSKLESSLLNCPDSLDADSPSFYREPLSLPHPTSVFFPNEPIRFVYPYDINENTSSAANGITSSKNLNGIVDLHNQSTTRHGNAGNTISTDGTTISNTNGTTSVTNIYNNNGTNIINGKSSTTQGKRYYNDIYSNTSLAKIFTKFDLDTLFFIFYHYQGSYEQFLAARELNKNRNWQFNKKDRCWYYKEIEKLPPGIISNSNTNINKLEEESWRYFDYKKSWLARRCNSDFVYNEKDFEVL
ncbi:CCR4-NOT core subunit NOT5 PWA37_000237 [Arxiozyma heterogenica]|uniref:General negative regulator of transcription subunit n=1 Tax=Arxiozyma heterogenica TaxID=278026 RepID=A0AAN7W0H7_9SACH|nr:hypothetical protein RI543_004173 [Kazachstania heterogenica]